MERAEQIVKLLIYGMVMKILIEVLFIHDESGRTVGYDVALVKEQIILYIRMCSFSHKITN